MVLLKQQEGGFLGATVAPIAASILATMGSSMIQPVASSLMNTKPGKRVVRAEKRKKGQRV